MILAIASGKGGTGKTTVAVNLALAVSMSKKEEGDAEVIFLDCDVEEPNAALFLHPEIEQRQEVGLLVPAIDLSRCTYCGRCAKVCQFRAIAVVEPRILFFPELCHGCGSCALNCPENAIHEKLRVSGVIEQGSARGSIRFAHGILNIGEATATPLIRQLKQLAIPPDTPRSLVILDAPPGTACPVVETMRGADVVLMVTEPTPFGLHDLRLAVQVAYNELNLPVAVVINRDGVGDDGVDRYCQSEGIPILMRIPLDRRIAEAYAEGQLVVEALPEYQRYFLDLYRRIEGFLERSSEFQKGGAGKGSKR
ncbi:MAG: ATP-binding protein [Anaerolineae bacterium]